MNIVDIINKKSDDYCLTEDEIFFTINSYVNGKTTDYQMSAFLMAIKINGMSDDEVYYLTKAMAHSGEMLDFSKNPGIYVDKHSTGGVSDTTTLIVAPIIACSGLKMLKSSGRGLGFTGGTADKIECFTGYKADLDFKSALKNVEKNGACLITQSKDFAPADKKIYALRDVTGTVNSIPLIASSVMSKKIACGSQVIVLDIKCGDGAFVEDLREAKELARLMVKIGNKFDRKVVAVISSMNQPLGYNVGNLFEVMEAIDVLKGSQDNLAYLSKFLSAKIIEKAKEITFNEAMNQVEEIISSNKAYEKFKDMIISSGGDFNLYDETPKITPKIIKADKEGYIEKIKTKDLAYIVNSLGAGRVKLDDKVDLNVGIKTFVKIGDKINVNDKIIEVYFKDVSKEQLKALKDCFIIGRLKKNDKLILKVIG